MEHWIPLFVAVVGAIAAIAVAYWNSRGEFAELRQLKAMNEVLGTMPESDQKQIFERARDALSVRVAARVATAPARRRLGWLIVGAIAVIAVVAAVLVLLSPFVPQWLSSDSAVGWISLAVGGLTAVGGAVSAFAFNKVRIAREQKQHEARLRAMQAWLKSHNVEFQPTSAKKPGRGRSA